MQPYVNRLTQDPLNAALHLEYAIQANRQGKPYLAYAELKTAAALGASPNKIAGLVEKTLAALPPADEMDHNQYFRFASLAEAITRRAGSDELTMLDVGGGQGQLAAFLPQASYCLAEPSVNGISGTALPFPDRAFDLVVACHVLEHIPPPSRDLFLDQLLAKSRTGVILLNPFAIESTHVEERLRLFVEITGAPWAREHLEHSLPRLETIKDYAQRRNLEIEIEPNGNVTTSTALVFGAYFAAKAGMLDEWKQVNRFYNREFMQILHSNETPNAYLIYLGRS